MKVLLVIHILSDVELIFCQTIMSLVPAIEKWPEAALFNSSGQVKRAGVNVKGKNKYWKLPELKAKTKLQLSNLF